MIQHVQGMAGIARRNRGMPHRAKILVTRCKTAPAEMRAANGVAREAAAMATEVTSTTAKMMPAAAEGMAAVTVATAVAATAPASMAALGEYVARQHQNERKNRNSQCAPEHGTLPAVTPPITRREC
jgi:hypothetical protein